MDVCSSDAFKSLRDSEAEPHQITLASLPLRSDSIRKAYGSNQSFAEYPHDLCVHQLLQKQALQQPESIAVEFLGHSLTYAELEARSNQLAHSLRQRGIRAETLVGVCLERSLEMLVAVLGVLKAGGAYVPLDPAYPDRKSVV